VGGIRIGKAKVLQGSIMCHETSESFRLVSPRSHGEA
jgi:hypothetical protein